MVFIIIIIAFMVTLFFVSVTLIKLLSKAKLKSSLKKVTDDIPESVVIETLKKILKTDPDDFESRLKLAKEYLKIKNYSEAIVNLNYILNNNKDLTTKEKTEIYDLLARCYTDSKNYEEAYKIYSSLRMQNPDDPSNYIKLAHIDLKLGNRDKAIKLLTKAASIDSTNITTLKELGVLLYESNKFPEAMSIFSKAHKISPEDTEINYYLGKLYYKFEKSKEAYRYFLVSKNDTKYTVESLFFIGKILFQHDKYDEALKVFNNLLKIPNLNRDIMLESRYITAEIYLRKKQIPEAIQQWEKILSFSSNYKDVREKLDRYEQTKTNSLLRNYMMATKNEFVSLCKKIASNFAKNVIIIRTQVNPDSTVELFTQAVYRDMATTILFKFFRSNSNIGQFAIREFYEKVKETKAKLGVCFTTSGYTEDAIAYSKGRVIELYDRKDLIKLLSKMDS